MKTSVVILSATALLGRAWAFVPLYRTPSPGLTRGLCRTLSSTPPPLSSAVLFSSAPASVDEPAAPADDTTPAPPQLGPWVLLEGLPYSAQEEDVFNFFQGLDVQSVSVPLSPPNSPRAGSSKGVGMVKFGSVDDASKAVQMHGKEIDGRWITVERCMDPAEATTVKVRGLPVSATAEDLEQLFSSCGQLDRITIANERSDIAYVSFKDNAATMQALGKDGCEFGNRWLDITLYLKSFRPQRKPRSGKNRVRMSGLPFTATAEDVQGVLQGLGVTVSDLYMPPFRASPSRNIGVAFITVGDEAQMNTLLEMGTYEMGDRLVYFSSGQQGGNPFNGERGGGQREGGSRLPPRRSAGQDGGEESGRGDFRRSRSMGNDQSTAWENRVYMGNLPFEMTTEDIVQYLEQNGVSDLARVALPKGKGGTAYLSFTSREMADKAVSLDGGIVEKDGRSRYLRANHMTTDSKQQRQRQQQQGEDQYGEENYDA